MIICLSGFVIAGASTGGGVGAARADFLSSCDRGVTYAPHQHQLLAQFAPGPGLPPGAGLPPLPTLLAHRGRCSSGSDSASSHSASPPPPPRPPAAPLRVRTLYACLGESDGELSFEPNQIITNVTPSPEPGWLRGTLNGRSGLVPENYVEPLP